MRSNQKRGFAKTYVRLASPTTIKHYESENIWNLLHCVRLVCDEKFLIIKAKTLFSFTPLAVQGKRIDIHRRLIVRPPKTRMNRSKKN